MVTLYTHELVLLSHNLDYESSPQFLSIKYVEMLNI